MRVDEKRRRALGIDDTQAQGAQVLSESAAAAEPLVVSERNHRLSSSRSTWQM